MKPDRTGQLQRGSLSATLLAAATTAPQPRHELRAQAQTALRAPVSAVRLQRSLSSLRALGYLTADHARTARGDAELARLRAPLRRGHGGQPRQQTGTTRRIRRLLTTCAPLGTAHLAAVLGIPRPRIANYLCALVRRGEVERVPESRVRQYRLVGGAA